MADSIAVGLLHHFLREYPFQPATAFWRTIEVRHILRHHLPEGTGLDLGCGDGRLTRIVLKHLGRRTLVGVDVDAAEVRAAARTGIYTRSHATPAHQIPEADESFDFVFSNSVLEHIPVIGSTLAEMARVMRRGARFLITVPGIGFPQLLRGPVLPWVTRRGYLRNLDHRLGHLRYWKAAQWSEALSPHGLQITCVSPYLSARELHRWEDMSRATAGVLHALLGHRWSAFEIQKRLGIRQSLGRLPSALVRPLAGMLVGCLGPGPPTGGESSNACILIEGRRP